MQQPHPQFVPGLSRHLSGCLLLLAALIGATTAASRASAQDKPVGQALIRITSPKPGAAFDAPGPVVFVGHAIDPAGDIRHIEFFANDVSIGKSDFWAKIATIPGMVIPHRLVWEGVAPGSYKIVARGQDSKGNPVESEALPIEVVRPVNGRYPLVIAGAEWRFQNDSTDLGSKWREVHFDDSQWPAGPAELGYGDGDESTVTRTDGPPHPITAYFRHTFRVPADLSVSRLELGLVRDDGAVVYLNGKELVRDNVPEGELTAATPATASTDNENRVRRFLVGAGALVAGENVLAVEVHQAGPSSSDLSFDLQVTGLSSDTPALTSQTVGLIALNPATSEPRPEARIAPGRAVLRRTGDLTRELAVFLHVGGSATAGKDYTEISSPVIVPAGKSEAEVLVVALDDEFVEGTESVVIELAHSPAAGPLPTYDIDERNARVEVEIRDADEPKAAGLVITAPERGARFPEGEVIPVAVTAIDPESYIHRVELFDGEASIGVSEILFIVAPEPGTPIHHTFEWKGASPGEHRLIARAKRGEDARWVSEPVPIVVGDVGGPFVSLEGLNLTTSEPRPEARIAPGRVVLRRTGDTARELRVLLKIGGSATPGRDYSEIENPAVIPAGKSEVELFVGALDDDQVEGTETVEIGLAIDRLALVTYAIDPRHSRVEVEIHDADRPRTAGLVITSPEHGARFSEGAVIPVVVTAIDPEGYISRVELFDGERLIGESEITFIVAPEPGTPIHHTFEWKGASVGEHRLIARARRGDDARWVSEPVPIVVGDTPAPVVLEIAATDDEARENGSGEGSNTARFLVRRVSGPKDVALTAFYLIQGTAQNGADYVRLTGEATLRAGQESVEIVVRALPDRWTEPTETVALTLVPPPCIAIFPPPPQCYQVGEKSAAKAAILDADKGGDENAAPVVKVVSPEPGSVFSEGDTIALAAEATDRDGTIARLDLLAGDKLLGSAKEGSLKVAWREAGLGVHHITARAVDDQGAESTSRPVPIYVRELRERAFVVRDLPPAYLPGAVLEVQLIVHPPRGGAAWLVEEAPPEGWAVSEISDDGTFDASVGRVKFGPFTEARERTLTYRVTVPMGTEGAQKFAGTSSLDGEAIPVAGETTVEPAGLHHPADAPTPDNAISGNEVTAYAAAWKLGKDWAGTGIIPLSYVTRAGFLWRSGERYLFDAGRGTPPECWMPAGPRRPAPSGLVSDDDDPAKEFRRALPASWRPGKPGAVELLIRPPEGTVATAVEEVLPVGWRAVEISDAGAYDSASRTIRWGLLEGDQTRTLTYRAVPPGDAACTGAFAGQVSFDGAESAIVGASAAGATDETTALRIVSSRKEKGGKPRLTIEAPAQQVFVVEGSSDLQTWTEISAHLFTGDEVEIDDPKAGPGAAQRYYRLRPVGR